MIRSGFLINNVENFWTRKRDSKTFDNKRKTRNDQTESCSNTKFSLNKSSIVNKIRVQILIKDIESK